jgi:ABC-type transporter Mla subunit MlaD
MLRKTTLFLIIAVGLVTIAILLIGVPSHHRHYFKACFTDAQGLRSGAAVRLAGVEIGTVRRVLVNPQRKDCPAEVEISIASSNEIRIPKDSIVEVGTAGVLGETYIEIDTSAAFGVPLEDYGYLRTRSTNPPMSFKDVIEHLGAAIGRVKGAQEIDEKGFSPKNNPCPPQPEKRRPKAAPVSP